MADYADILLVEDFYVAPRCARGEEPTDEELRAIEAQEDAGFWS